MPRAYLHIDFGVRNGIVTLHYLKGAGAKYIRTMYKEIKNLILESKLLGLLCLVLKQKMENYLLILWTNLSKSILCHLILFKSTTHARFPFKRKIKIEKR